MKQSQQIVLIFLLCINISQAQNASFQGLDDLTGGTYDSCALGVSSDGSVVVGWSRADTGCEAICWNNGQMKGLGDLPDGYYSRAFDVSSDGKIIAGGSLSAPMAEALVWVDEQMISLGTLGANPNGHSSSDAHGISADGSVVVGVSSSIIGHQAFLWKNNQMIGLGDLPGGNFYSNANAVSGDGCTVVGTSSSYISHMEAFLWKDNQMVGLGNLYGEAYYSDAEDISDNGLVVVGHTGSPWGDEAFRWENGQMVGLGDLPGGKFYSHALGTSKDGSIVVGISVSDTAHEAFIWSYEEGIRSLKNLLENSYGLDLTGWILSIAQCISDDGLTIAGFGRNPSGYYQAWKATIPEPALQVTIDIKPTSCPNPLNTNNQGVLPIAILGSEEFDASTIVPTSVRLAGIEPIRDSLEDVSAPLDEPNECECTTNGPDGFTDLTLKFKTQQILETLGEVNTGDILTLTLTGVLNDGTPIEGADCIVIKGKHKPINKADINKDGVVDSIDFAIIAEQWLQSSIVK